MSAYKYVCVNIHDKKICVLSLPLSLYIYIHTHDKLDFVGNCWINTRMHECDGVVLYVCMCVRVCVRMCCVDICECVCIHIYICLCVQKM